MNSAQIITIVVGLTAIVLGFVAGRKSNKTFSVVNEAAGYYIDLEVHPEKHLLVIKGVIPTDSAPSKK